MLSQINNKIKTFDQNKTQHNKVIEQILTPDYFLPSSHSESYYSKKYSGNHFTSTSISSNAICQSKRSKISRVASVMLLSLGFLTTAVEVKASDSIELQKEASSGQHKEYKFEAINLSNNLPDVVPTLPLPDLIPSNPQVAPAPPPPPSLPDIVPPVILPDVVPVPPAPPMAPSMPDLLSDAGNSKSGSLVAVSAGDEEQDIGGEATVVSGNSNHEKLSTNIGGGLIVSHKNMALEFLYDMQKQRSFKTHQGILKLKVNL